MIVTKGAKISRNVRKLGFAHKAELFCHLKVYSVAQYYSSPSAASIKLVDVAVIDVFASKLEERLVEAVQHSWEEDSDDESGAS